MNRFIYHGRVESCPFGIDQYQEMAENNNCFSLQDPCFPSIVYSRYYVIIDSVCGVYYGQEMCWIN